MRAPGDDDGDGVTTLESSMTSTEEDAISTVTPAAASASVAAWAEPKSRERREAAAEAALSLTAAISATISSEGPASSRRLVLARLAWIACSVIVTIDGSACAEVAIASLMASC